MKKNEIRTVRHEFEPVYGAHSRILILGSFPSVKSREEGFYYGNPQNRFWKVLSGLYGDKLPGSVGEKKVLLERHGIALWDVIAECDIAGSSDSSIRNVKPADLALILSSCSIRRIYTNGRTAGKLYAAYQQPLTGIPSVTLPSTSPANAAWNYERLLEAWHKIL